MLAELLAGLLLRAAEEHQRQAAAAAAGGPAVWARRSAEVEAALADVPPPMIPGNAEEPTSLCAIQVGLAGWGRCGEGGQRTWEHALLQRRLTQPTFAQRADAAGPLACPPLRSQEAFQPMVVAQQGFEWRAERPEEDTFVGQKWGWTGLRPGAWADLEFDSRGSRDAPGTTDAAAPAGTAGTAAAAGADGGSSEAQQPDDGGSEEAEEGGDEAEEEDAQDPQEGQPSEQRSRSGGAADDAGTGGARLADPDAMDEEGSSNSSNSTAAAAGRQQGKQQREAEVLLSHLKSYEGMGVAQLSGCLDVWVEESVQWLLCNSPLIEGLQAWPAPATACGETQRGITAAQRLTAAPPTPLLPPAGAVRVRLLLPHHLPGRHLGPAGHAAADPPLQGAAQRC